MTHGNTPQERIASAEQFYHLPLCGEGFFRVHATGQLTVHPAQDTRCIIVPELVRRVVREAGLSLPLLLHFDDILYARVRDLCQAFAASCQALGYQGQHRPVYPIKVNQKRSVVQALLQHPQLGLEAGSKPELLAVLSLARPPCVVVCNGYKDQEYMRLALRGQQAGLEVHIIIEKMEEWHTLWQEAQALGVTPCVGVRIRPVSMGAGHWQNTGGDKSKFGLPASQVLQLWEQMCAKGAGGWLRTVHMHLGSQLANIRHIKEGVQEAAQYYAQLYRMGAPLQYVDVGGGLGVDYEGTRNRQGFSMNHTIAEYAMTVLQSLRDVCQQAQVPEPHVITESGRAMVAHHAMLVVPVVDVEAPCEGVPPDRKAGAAEVLPPVLRRLQACVQDVQSGSGVLEAYHQLEEARRDAEQQFAQGRVDLTVRAHADALYRWGAQQLWSQLDPALPSHRAVWDDLSSRHVHKIFCNFSVFQSVPDVWGLDHIFPVVPLSHWDRPLAMRGVLHDLTCDSDGTIERFAVGNSVQSALPLPAWSRQDPYLLGILMVGAYQEILGDRHNLLGETASVHVRLEDQGHTWHTPSQGQCVGDMLSTVGYTASSLRDLPVPAEERVALLHAITYSD